MSGLTPQPIELLLGRALAEFGTKRSVFDLPRRSFWQGRAGLDLSVDALGERVATPLGPAAGPHTQLAQNLVIGWLAGARALELKTVQVGDRLTIARPCIDAPDVGYNVEWSQELRLEDSALQYATAWFVIHVLAARGLLDEAAGPRELSFDASVGYDLAGISSAPVAHFLDSMTDARELLAGLRKRLPAALRVAADVPVPVRIARTVTLSTFHGCPPEEIERMVEHLFARHAVNVVIKLNPTLLGYAEMDALLRGRLGYEEIALDRSAFATDLGWDAALELFRRLGGAAERCGRALGAKFTNTLVVRNGRRVLAGEEVYLSGPPLHPVAVTLAARFAAATAGRIPISFSGGIQADNFADAVACGLAPVTTCTDLLRPTGYRRLPRYLKALADAMEHAKASSVAGLMLARAGIEAPQEPGQSAPLSRTLGLTNLSAYAARVVDDPAYHASGHRPTPVRAGRLSLFDCASCNNCLLACPNGAFFSLPIAPLRVATCELREEISSVNEATGAIAATPLVFEIVRDRQWAVFADFCNECGNCTTFCPEEGEPERIKPRFFGSRAGFEAAGDGDGILLEEGGRTVTGRLSGRLYSLVRDDGLARFSDGILEATLDQDHRVLSTRRLAPGGGAVLSLWPYHALRVLRDAVLLDINPVTAGLGVLPAGPGAARACSRRG